LTPTTDTYLLLRAFVDELARCGLAGACTSPGSRSTPLVLSLVRDGRVPCFSHLDERCAGFFAVGLAKAAGRPAALACTSGTAAAHFLPAVIEAWEARVPLIVLSADRPPELRGVGAGQTIDQLKLYGGAAKWFFEVGTHEATPERQRWIRALACRAYWTAVDGRPGPVHLNFPLREPLVLDEPLAADEPGNGGRPGGAPWIVRTPPPESAAETAGVLRDAVATARRGVLVAGRYERGAGLADAAPAFAEAWGFPLLADPLSGARRGRAAVAHYDGLLRDAGFAGGHRPDLVVRVGDLPTSKPLRAWLAGLTEAQQVVLDPECAWQDPDSVAALSLPLDPGPALGALVEGGAAAEPAWLGSWRAADHAAATAIADTLGDDLTEPRVATLLAAELPPEATLFVASSMPVRDVETFAGARDDAPRVLSNRGANGIDGLVSAAFGAAAAGGGPVVLLIGDVALAHDATGLLAARRLSLAITIVLVDNAGGGIFEFLPVAGEADAFEEHVATPHGLDFARLADVYGCDHAAVADVAGLRGGLDAALGSRRTTILHVRTDRKENVALHRAVWAAVAAAL
jgi:2-succinyl-5-enolpyruvyl-6-hydroxy-3-cyclohexene-1-carboxylate synthase